MEMEHAWWQRGGQGERSARNADATTCGECLAIEKRPENKFVWPGVSGGRHEEHPVVEGWMAA